MTYKAVFCILAGAFGGVILEIFGAWSLALTVLCICMAIDYSTGLVVAGIFKASPKSASGGLDSNIGWRGLFRKVATLVIVLVAHFVDVLLGTNYIRDAVVIAFTINEILSILENCGLMGVPIPAVLLNGIDVLRRRVEAAEAVEVESATAQANAEPEQIEAHNLQEGEGEGDE